MEKTRVTRSLRPGAPGTRRMQLSYGSSLVCVRYRETADGQTRWTTVELIVDRRPTLDSLVCIAADWREKLLHARLRSAGARYDSRRCCWVTSLRTARRLKVQDRIIGMAPLSSRLAASASKRGGQG
jgi:hypothetical protein